MELEDQWWKGQLAADIYQALRYKELKLPSYKGQSPQLNLRRYFADLIAIVSNRFRLCPAARHLAIYLLDLFMDRYDVTVQQLHMCVTVEALHGVDLLLLIAGKFEEREDRVPKLETLNSLGCMSSMNLVLTKQGLLHMELLLLETFQWNLYLPTAAHFIEYYLSIAVHEGDLHDGWAYDLPGEDQTVHGQIMCFFAHDSDVKEASKQKCQQPGQQQQQWPDGVPQFGPDSHCGSVPAPASMQYPQQLHSRALVPNHRACLLPQSLYPPARQPPNGPQHGNTQAHRYLAGSEVQHFQQGLTKSACTTPARLRALTDDGCSGFSHFLDGE
ncbi:Cyclin-J [Nibea albiflora]|nr:Cyclin-J [Nibea albiflora]